MEGKGWTFVKDLKVGDLLVQSDGNTLKVDSIELEHKQVRVYNMTVDEFHTYFVSDLNIWVHNTNCVQAWIKRDTYTDIQDAFGKEAANKFSNAMKKGFVNSAKSDNGIKALSGSGEKIGSTYYKYEIKVVGKYGNARVYGNLDQKSGHIIFTKFVKSH
ncbi:hypothetical protein ABH894_003722 [Paenibacillus sp. RC62]